MCLPALPSRCAVGKPLAADGSRFGEARPQLTKEAEEGKCENLKI